MPAPGKLSEQVDDRVDDRRVEHVRGGLVVPRGNALVEIAVVVHGGNLRTRTGGPRSRRVVERCCARIARWTATGSARSST
jgi:hypothetical protein